jgi:16S rRNA (cytidine1402-2'-O)-methyltransferase
LATLYIVATPIGNLQDISARALEVLANVSVIACEDTRTSGVLLKHYSIKTEMMSFHAHNEHHKTEKLIERLDAGFDLALISDAGMPTISDPGFLVVRAAHSRGHVVTVIPGASAAITAIAASGLPSDKFCFEGFLPQKKGRKTRIRTLKDETRTMIFFESPFRIIRLINELITEFGEDRPGCFCRELTKKFEEVKRGTLRELHQSLSERPAVKGEFVLVVAGKGYTE